MPIAVRVVRRTGLFSAWIEEANKKYARNEALPSDCRRGGRNHCRKWTPPGRGDLRGMTIRRT